MTRTLFSLTPGRIAALALVAALAGAATLAQAQNDARLPAAAQLALDADGGGPGGPGGPGGHGLHGGRHMGHEGKGMGWPLHERALDAVGASADQKQRIRGILDAARNDLRGQRDARRAQHDQAMSLFAQPNIDARAAEAMRQQMLQQHDQASRRMMQAMLDASAVLSPEQRAKLVEMGKQRRSMAERHMRERQGLEGGQAPRR